MSAEEVRRIRKKVSLSRASFARRFGFDEKTVRRWEIGEATPYAHNAVLLTLIDRLPEHCNRIAAELRRNEHLNVEKRNLNATPAPAALIDQQKPR